MMNEDVRDVLDRSPMRARQIIAIALCVLLNAIDGFDVLSISFAAPGIAKEWGIDRGALGIVLSMELIGMTIGSIGLGVFCDRFGRRPTVLGCLFIMTVGMALAMYASSIETLSVYRLLTGLGIGGMLAATNAMTAEYSNRRHRNMAIAIMAGGYPVGAIIGGSIASMMFAAGYEWRLVFALGAVASATCIPLVWFLLPETVSYLVDRRPANALARLNTTLRKFGYASVTQLPEPAEPPSDKGIARLFSPALAGTTILLTLAYFAHILTFYFILKWVPKIVVDMGFAASAAGGVLVWVNVGGAIGALSLSLMTQKLPVRWLTIGVMLLSTVMVSLFGRSSADLGQLALIAAIAGFFTNAGMVGLYAIVAQSFPTTLRASGTGFVIGVGRGGAVLSPIAAGFLFQGGVSLPVVAMVMAMGSILGAVALLLLRYNENASST